MIRLGLDVKTSKHPKLLLHLTIDFMYMMALMRLCENVSSCSFVDKSILSLYPWRQLSPPEAKSRSMVNILLMKYWLSKMDKTFDLPKIKLKPAVILLERTRKRETRHPRGEFRTINKFEHSFIMFFKISKIIDK